MSRQQHPEGRTSTVSRATATGKGSQGPVDEKSCGWAGWAVSPSCQQQTAPVCRAGDDQHSGWKGALLDTHGVDAGKRSQNLPRGNWHPASRGISYSGWGREGWGLGSSHPCSLGTLEKVMHHASHRQSHKPPPPTAPAPRAICF